MPTGNQRAMKCRAVSDWSYETPRLDQAAEVSIQKGIMEKEGNNLLLTVPIFPLRSSQPICHESHSLPSFCLSRRKAANKEKWLLIKVSKVLLILPKHFSIPLPSSSHILLQLRPSCKCLSSGKGQQLLPEEQPTLPGQLLTCWDFLTATLQTLTRNRKRERKV